jgi:hypothetical protein
MIYFYDPVGLDRVVISTSYRETPFGIHKENMKGPYAGNALLVLCRNIKAFVQKKNVGYVLDHHGPILLLKKGGVKHRD